MARKEFCKRCLVLAGYFARAPLLAGNLEESMKKKGRKQEGKEIVGACGIVCSECPAYIATQREDDVLRAQTAKEWSAMYHADIQPENINCDGCPGRKAGVPVGDCSGREAGVPAGDRPGQSPRLFAHCLECGIRACAHGRKFVTCASCPDYACQRLQEFFAMVPQAKVTLDRLRNS